jgi:hypothetical protein
LASKKISAAGQLVAFGSLLTIHGAFADVTVQEQMSLDVSIVKAHTTETSYFSGEKKRHEYQFACDGMMKLLCGKQNTLDIERIDEGVTWRIDDKQRTYTETTLITPEQWQKAMKQQQAAYDKLRSCPATRSASPAGPDTSKCEMSEPQIAIAKTADHATILGHDSQRTNITLSQSCKVRETGEECLLAYEYDVWLTQEEIAGMADRRAFEQAYLKKQGMSGDMMANPTLARAMAPYADSFRKLSAKSGDLKGLPLRTRFRFAYGGPQCKAGGGGGDAGSSQSVAGNAGASARSAAEGSTAGAAGSVAAESAARSAGSGPGGYIASSTAGAFASSLVGGMFAKHRASESTTSPAAPADATMTTANGQKLQTFAEMTVETVSIDAAPVAAGRFEVPAGYKKLTPATVAKSDETPSCPSS